MDELEIETAPPQVQRQVVPLRGPWDLMVRGWRPFGGWACGLILLVRGVVIPLVQLSQNKPIEPLDIVALTALVGVLGLDRSRRRERLAGVTG